MKELDEHSQWEEEWARAFEDARQAPSPNVWNNIHAVQANKEADKFRKRAAFYKWVAAASVFISICSAALLFTSEPFYQQEGLTDNAASGLVGDEKGLGSDTAANSNSPAEGIRTQIAHPLAEDAGTASLTEAIREQESVDAGPIEKSVVPVTVKEKTEVRRENSQRSSPVVVHNEAESSSAIGAGASAIAAGSGSGREEDNTALQSRDLAHNEGGMNDPLSYLERKDLVALAANEGNTVEAEIRKVWVSSNFLKKDKHKSTPKYMLGATLASNNFSANYVDNSPEMASLAENSKDFSSMSRLSPLTNARVTEWNEEQESVVSVTGALQAAAWIGKRWVLQGGVQYGNYKTASNASSYTDAAGINSYPLHFANYSEEKGETASFRTRAASPVSATNSFEFLSVPLSIGYVVVDRKVSLLLSPGLSSEFFLSNTLSPEEGSGLSTYTVSNGEESPFSFVHFKGLISAQVFYRMSENYVISLEPGFQQAITDFNKSDSFFSSRPSNISIAAGFRYVFH